MTLREFYDALVAHDWYFEMTDSLEPWRAGLESLKKLDATAEQSPEHAALYRSFHEFAFSGPAWGTEKCAMPLKPDG